MEAQDGFCGKLKLCVFCAVVINGSDSEQNEKSNISGDKEALFLEGLSVLCEVLEVKDGDKFTEAGEWRPFGVDNFVSLVCCGKCFLILEELVALHRLILETQASLKKGVEKIKDFVVESGKEGDLEFTVNTCVSLRERILHSLSPGEVESSSPQNSNFETEPNDILPSTSASLGKRTALIKLERLQLPAAQVGEIDANEYAVEGDLNDDHRGDDILDEDDGCIGDCCSPTDPTSPRPVPPTPIVSSRRKNCGNKDTDEDYRPIPKRRRGTGGKRGRPRKHPAQVMMERIPRKRGRPSKNKDEHWDKVEVDDGNGSEIKTDSVAGRRRYRNRTREIIDANAYHPEDDELTGRVEHEGKEWEEEYQSSEPSSENEGGDDEEFKPDPIALSRKKPRISSTKSRRNDGPKKKAGHPPKPGSTNYRSLNQETPRFKPVYVLDPIKNLLMFYHVPFQRTSYSLQCLHPECTFAEPLPGHFADQVAFRNFRFHVSHQHRNRYKSLSDPETKSIFLCHLCDSHLDSREDLMVHRRTHHWKTWKMPPALCEVCGDSMPPSNIIEHTITHKNQEEKEAAFSTKPVRGKTSSAKDVTKPLQFPCDECPRVFKTHTELRIHKPSHIPIDIRKQHLCDVCGLKFTSQWLVDNHKKRIHLNELSPVRFRCHICNKEYRHYNKERCEEHLRTHTGEKPYQCTTCGQRFHGKENLQRHERRHLDNSVTCEFCSQVYKSERYLLRHHRKHHPELAAKPDPSKVRERKQDFIGPKQMYPCEPCKHVFVFKSVLISHLKRMHMDRFVEAQEFPVMWTMEDHYGHVGKSE